MGVLVVAPFLLVAWNRGHHRYLPPRRLELLELFVVLAVLAGVALFAVTADVSLLFVALPFVGWASWRFEQSGRRRPHCWSPARRPGRRSGTGDHSKVLTSSTG